ncbi:AraC family transcriptional regulator [Paenibacillus ginsengarvi]|uniref:AraC family transcriptional regulator n=1 Tax=Paenibacillus ginsengarvi TaxID=400777 RepID=A0A3B0AW15_9BACL|nr:AraC family transcriptional regulator [Paenibacillus ginsengarvi]RKN64572.1 AraC family transcriptional regulator [Paenibacillus ginsengarvi]
MVRKQYHLHMEFAIDRLYTFHYYELSRSFYDKGEKHDFWEFVYVDKGEMEVFTDFGRFQLMQGDIVFYAPNVYHCGGAKNAVNLIIVSFESKSPSMLFFENRAFRLEKDERSILTELLKEGFEAFDPPIDTQFTPYLGKKERSPFGCEHLIKNYLEIFLIKLFRRHSSRHGIGGKPDVSIIPHDKRKLELIEEITEYMKSRISTPLTFEQICNHFFIGKTRLKSLFKEMTGLGIMQYFTYLKIEEAKSMIREERYNYTEIAERLGYSSIHYFSSCFKKATDMTPTEYARTVLAKIHHHKSVL